MKTTTLSAGVALLCSLLLCNSAMAYDPKPGHLRLTELSYQKLAQCRGEVVNPARLQRLQDGNLAMDEAPPNCPLPCMIIPGVINCFRPIAALATGTFIIRIKPTKRQCSPALSICHSNACGPGPNLG